MAAVAGAAVATTAAATAAAEAAASARAAVGQDVAMPLVALERADSVSGRRLERAASCDVDKLAEWQDAIVGIKVGRCRLTLSHPH
jgi:hypothetical protein